MINAVFFDFDGVLTPHVNDGYTTCLSLSQYTGISVDKLLPGYSKHLQKLYAGRETNQSIWPEFCREVGQTIDIGLLEGAFKSTPKNEAMLDLARRLKHSDLIVGIITNNTADRYEVVRKEFNLDEIFRTKLQIVSAQVGYTKSGEYARDEEGKPIIFLTALEAAHVNPDESVFIDNSPSNLVIPKQMGIHAIHHHETTMGISELENKLKELGVDI